MNLDYTQPLCCALNSPTIFTFVINSAIATFIYHHHISHYLSNMGSLFLQIGQCGCQIGAQLNSLLSNSYYATRNRPPFRLHAIMVDTEPKVLKPFIDKPPKWLDSQNVRYFEHGRGNNWSYGYMHQLPEKIYHEQFIANHKQFSHIKPNSVTMDRYLTENKQICGYILDRIRKQLQTVDCAMCLNVIASLGGGTGSGLGTKMIEKIDEQFNIDIYSHLVLPNKSGQTPLQVYNCTLSLATIQEHSKAIFTYENDKMITLFQNTEESNGSLVEINKYLSSSISKLIRINDIPKYDRFYRDIVSECIISDQCKYLNLFASEDKDKKWDLAFESLFDQIKNYHHDSYGEQFTAKNQSKQKLFQGELILIGKQNSEYSTKYEKKLRNILNPMFQKSLNVEQINHKGTHTSSLIEEGDKKDKKEGQRVETVLVSNHSNILRYLGYLYNSGIKKYEARAYLWHYQYADLSTAFDKLLNVIDQYEYLAHQ